MTSHAFYFHFFKLRISQKVIGISSFCNLHVIQDGKVADKHIFTQNRMSDIKGATSEKHIFRQIRHISTNY